jgi:hypothetical protein
LRYLDFPEQEKMTLKADIKYKSNWQMGAVKGIVDIIASVYAGLYSIIALNSQATEQMDLHS